MRRPHDATVDARPGRVSDVVWIFINCRHRPLVMSHWRALRTTVWSTFLQRDAYASATHAQHGTCYGPVSVRHTRRYCIETDEQTESVFSTYRLPYTACCKEFGYLQTQGISCWNLVTNSAELSRVFLRRHVDRRMQVLSTYRSTVWTLGAFFKSYQKLTRRVW